MVEILVKPSFDLEQLCEIFRPHSIRHPRHTNISRQSDLLEVSWVVGCGGSS